MHLHVLERGGVICVYHIEDKGHFAGIYALLLSCGPWEWDSTFHAWLAEPLPSGSKSQVFSRETQVAGSRSLPEKLWNTWKARLLQTWRACVQRWVSPTGKQSTGNLSKYCHCALWFQTLEGQEALSLLKTKGFPEGTPRSLLVPLEDIWHHSR